MLISNVELTLLELLAEFEELSGYEINGLIERRGFREWAGIGTTSIYQGLKKLEKKKLLQSRIATEKKGKGPLPRFFRITEEGWNQLREALRNAIRDTDPQNTQFPLVLAGMIWLDKKEIQPLMKERLEALSTGMDEVRRKMDLQGGNKLPFHIRELFRHSFVHMEAEMNFILELIEQIRNK